MLTEISVIKLRERKKLYQQFLGDIWIRIDKERLSYLQWAQASDLVEQKDALDTYIVSTPNPDMSIPRSPVLLPSSFIGAPRLMQQKYQDAYSCVEKTENPLGSLHSQ